MKYFFIVLTILLFLSCKQKYNKEIWTKSDNQHSDNPRFEMIEDLKQNYLIKGTSCKKVFEILDKAENIDTTAFGIHWTYSIGSNPGFNVDPFYLVVDFDLDGNLTKNRVIEH